MQKRTLKWFTLVELIVVITILAILWTIAFISIQWYTKNARDSRRVSDINNIQKSLELFTLQTEKYPLPDNAEAVSYSWEVVYYQGVLWDNVTDNLSINLKKKPTDPLTDLEYIYSTTNSRKEYEVVAVYEWSISYSPILPQTHAANLNSVKVDGTYNQLYVKTNNYIIPTPSIITAEVLPFTLDNTNIKSQIVSGQLNRPAQWTNVAQTGWLDIVLSVYTWSITTDSSEQDKQNAVSAIQWAYSGTLLASAWPYEYVLNQTSTWELVAFADTSILSTPSWWTASSGGGWWWPSNSCATQPSYTNASFTVWSPSSSNEAWQNTNAWNPCYYTCTNGYTWNDCSTPPLTWWRALDSNCDIDDITIGSQVWAWCNSTLWNWFEWWKQDNGSNGTVWSCYNYSGTNNATCTIWDSSMASNTKANTWFTGTNTNSDTEVANIWWKFYTWANRDSACGTWYHVPSDAEWTTLENTLNGSTCRTWDGWQCDGLGWKLHDTKTTSNNITQALKIPLAGYRSTDGTTFYSRGYYTNLWSSTPNGGNAYRRVLGWYGSAVYRDSYSQSYGFSVRCIKD